VRLVVSVGAQLINEQSSIVVAAAALPKRETIPDCMFSPLPLGLRDATRERSTAIEYRIIYNPPTGAFVPIVVATHVQEKASPPTPAGGFNEQRTMDDLTPAKQ